jgi:hypothetical protein
VESASVTTSIGIASAAAEDADDNKEDGDGCSGATLLLPVMSPALAENCWWCCGNGGGGPEKVEKGGPTEAGSAPAIAIQVLPGKDGCYSPCSGSDGGGLENDCCPTAADPPAKPPAPAEYC